ncbi:NRT1/ PTR family 8.2-like protein [Tanacetum coccineum]
MLPFRCVVLIFGGVTSDLFLPIMKELVPLYLQGSGKHLWLILILDDIGQLPHSPSSIQFATNTQTALCFTSLYLVTLGTGRIKPYVSSYGAYQFDDNDEVEKKQKGSFFNWFYYVINIGALFGKHRCSKFYRNKKPGGSPLTRLCQVVVATFRKKEINVPSDSSPLYETSHGGFSYSGSRKIDHTLDFIFSDKAVVVKKYWCKEVVIKRSITPDVGCDLLNLKTTIAFFLGETLPNSFLHCVLSPTHCVLSKALHCDLSPAFCLFLKTIIAFW